MEAKSLIFLGVCLLACVVAQTPFQATIKIWNDPKVTGALNGTFYYDPTVNMSRTDYTIGPKEILLYSKKLRYLTCGASCDTETYSTPMPILWKETSDVSAGNVVVNGLTCQKWTKPYATNPGQVVNLYIYSGNVVKAEFVNGKYFTFSDFATLSANNSVLYEYRNWSCPAQTCKVQMDLVLVFDESGSISSTSWKQEKDFGVSVVGSFEIGPQATWAGLVTFSTTARVVQNLTNNLDTIKNKISTVNQQGGSTCIPCGIERGRYVYTYTGRTGVQKVLIVLTDGENNVNNDQLNPQIAAAEAQGTYLFAIGVGSAVNQAQITNIGSTIYDSNGQLIQTAFFSPSFSQLQSILNVLIQATCIEMPTTPCGDGCLGFCGCQRTCYCPDICDDNDACTDGSCVAGSNGNGCRYTPVVCNDGNACTIDSCNSASGCYSTPVDGPTYCNDYNVCTKDDCDSAIGCFYVDLTNVKPAVLAGGCDDSDPCTVDSCDAVSGCAHSAPPPQCQCANKVCPQDRNCEVNTCDIADGLCKYSNKTCDDGNACSSDSCDRVSGNCVYTPVICDDGNNCTLDSCDPTSGCVFTAVPADYCDDANNCTIDSCVAPGGCQHINVDCDDGDKCTKDTCNSILGCQFPALECVPDSGDCYEGTCTEGVGCTFKQIGGTKADNCGVCNGDGSSCLFGLKTEEVAAIGTGALVGIILAGVAVCAALGVFGGKKGYDLWLKHQNAMSNASTNPLYNDSGMSGTNPFYADKDAAKM